jgi:hypothetical protein
MSETKTNSLHALVAQASKIEEMLAENSGQITEEIEQALAVVDLHLPVKVDNYRMTIDRFKKIGEFYAEKAAELTKIADGARAVVARVESNMLNAIKTLGVKEICGNAFKFTLVDNNPALVIEDENLIPGAFITIKTEEVTTVTIDKKRITEELKMGAPVPGAILTRGQRLKLGINKAGK